MPTDAAAACSCETIAHGQHGPVKDTERLVRILTEKHFKADGSLRPTAFSLKDIRHAGVSLIRAGFTNVVEFQAIADDIRASAKAHEIRGALVAEASGLRQLRDGLDRRELCVKDDPVHQVTGVRDNPAHAIGIATSAIDEVDAKDIRDRLLCIFTEARTLGEVWHDAVDRRR